MLRDSSRVIFGINIGSAAWCALQVWVYEDMDESGESNIFVHHDIILPAFPLSVAWMDCNISDTSAAANLAAVRPIAVCVHASVHSNSLWLCYASIRLLHSRQDGACLRCVQVGSISPGIEIWDLDILDAVEPLATLGGEVSAASKADANAPKLTEKKKKKKKKSEVGYWGCTCNCFIEALAVQ